MKKGQNTKDDKAYFNDNMNTGWAGHGDSKSAMARFNSMGTNKTLKSKNVARAAKKKKRK